MLELRIRHIRHLIYRAEISGDDTRAQKLRLWLSDLVRRVV
jgi:hypothetical protein